MGEHSRNSSESDSNSLHDEIHDGLVVDEPDADDLFAAVGDSIQIVRGSHQILLQDEIYTREPADRVMTYLLGRYCASRLSDGKVPLATDRADLIERFGRDCVDDAITHGWIEHWDNRVRLNPRFHDATSKELSRRYATDDEQ
jgi:hypothetical protein